MAIDWEEQMQETIGLGVAGNFTGHLEQAGEASDFEGLAVSEVGAPKGLFPFYVPAKGEHFLHRLPVCSRQVRLGSQHERHQVEPEVALLCDVEYREGRVSSVTPRFAMAHNDCSIRREGAAKISEKKNWGTASKGTSSQCIELDTLGEGGRLDSYRLASFLLRGGELHEYGVDSAVTGYSYYGERLLAWLVDRMNEQRDEGPLEDISRWLEVAGYPPRALISIGATRYTAFGETNFLERGDEVIVVLYDAGRYSAADVRELANGARPSDVEGVSLLRQNVV